MNARDERDASSSVDRDLALSLVRDDPPLRLLFSQEGISRQYAELDR